MAASKLPADNRRTCPKCHKQFRRERGSRRTNCYTCSPSRVRPAEAPAEVPPVELPPGPIEVVALAELAAASRINTVEGQLLLRVARQADQATGSQLAGVVDRVLKAKAAALAGVEKPRNDRVDELARARANKAASA